MKVQRPGVRTKVRTDLSLIKDVVRLLEGILRKNGILNPMDIVEVFEEMMLNELDYQNERRNILYFRKLYASKNGFYVPEVLEANSSSRVLIIEFISGCKITDLPQLKAWGLDTKKIAEQCLQSYLLQIFDYGYFHADPHPGNLLVRPNGTIVLIDFGMVGRLNRQDKYALAGMFNSLAQQDARGMAMNIRRLSLDSDIEDMKMFEIDLNDLIEDLVIYGETSEGMSLITKRLQSLIYQYDLKMPGSVYMILRALVILEGNSAMLSPEIHLFEYLKPYGFKILREQFSPQNVTLDLFYTAQQVTSLLYHFPTELRSIIRKVRKGQLNLNVYLKGIEPLFSKLDRAANKVAGALVTSALLISSAITMTATYPPDFPRLLGFPIISFAGFVLSGLYGTFLLYYLIKKRS